MDTISVQPDDFDLNLEMTRAVAQNPQIGAVVSFVGLVRDFPNQTLRKMTLEHYPGMTEKALQAIVVRAKNRWDLGNITVIHRVGDLPVGAQIVLVIATSSHRKSAFEACEFIIDFLKTDAPFWKQEHDKNGANWVDAKNSDLNHLKKWAD